MKKLTLDPKPLLVHNIKQVKIGMGQYLPFCQKTAEEAINTICTNKLPQEINWKYPEQFLSLRQQGHIASLLHNADIEINILSTNPIWGTHCRMDEVIEIVEEEEYQAYLYGRAFGYDIWHHVY